MLRFFLNIHNNGGRSNSTTMKGISCIDETVILLLALCIQTKAYLANAGTRYNSARYSVVTQTAIS